MIYHPIVIDDYWRKTYEYSITLASEISLIWKSSWTIPKVLFILTRYLPFVSLMIILLRRALPSLSIDACLGIDKYVDCQLYVSLAVRIIANDV